MMMIMIYYIYQKAKAQSTSEKWAGCVMEKDPLKVKKYDGGSNSKHLIMVADDLYSIITWNNMTYKCPNSMISWNNLTYKCPNSMIS